MVLNNTLDKHYLTSLFYLVWKEYRYGISRFTFLVFYKLALIIKLLTVKNFYLVNKEPFFPLDKLVKDKSVSYLEILGYIDTLFLFSLLFLYNCGDNYCNLNRPFH